jgi:pSer/pThr/pTyr-binding forkhead associated (FHA) protein
MDADQAAVQASDLTLHLLDAATGRPMQTWRFQAKAQVVIGRGDDADLVVVDPKVSRCHAILRYREGTWWLESRGRNGTQVDGEKVTEALLQDKSVFRLGSNGPMFQCDATHNDFRHRPTVDSIDPAMLASLVVDEAERAKDVEEIASGWDFHQLRAQARKLRAERSQNET